MGVEPGARSQLVADDVQLALTELPTLQDVIERVQSAQLPHLGVKIEISAQYSPHYPKSGLLSKLLSLLKAEVDFTKSELTRINVYGECSQSAPLHICI